MGGGGGLLENNFIELLFHLLLAFGDPVFYKLAIEFALILRKRVGFIFLKLFFQLLDGLVYRLEPLAVFLPEKMASFVLFFVILKGILGQFYEN